MINIPPKEGWKEHTVYLVDVMLAINNIEHRAILHVGFLKSGVFQGYCEVWQNSYNSAYNASNCFSIKWVKTLCKL